MHLLVWIGVIVLGFAAHSFKISGIGDEDVVFDVSGYDTICVDLVTRIAIIKDKKIDKSFRSEIYDAINNKIRWRAPISNPYLYLYQYLIMHSMHIGMNAVNDYQKYYYDNKKIKIIY